MRTLDLVARCVQDKCSEVRDREERVAEEVKSQPPGARPQGAVKIVACTPRSVTESCGIRSLGAILSGKAGGKLTRECSHAEASIAASKNRTIFITHVSWCNITDTQLVRISSNREDH